MTRVWVVRMSLTLALTAGVAADGGHAHHVTSGRVVVVCPLTVGGRFEITTSAVTGQISVDEQTREVGGILAVDLRSLDAGIGLRTTHLKDDYLEIHRGPAFAAAALSDIVLDVPLARLPNGPVGFQGQFTVHGQTRPVAGNVEFSRKAGQYDIKARFPLRIDAFQIATPAYLGVGVSNDIEVIVRVTFVRASGSAR